jgi:citrate synthase
MQSSSSQSSGERLLRAREAAARLGVKLDTLYAYVSRGLLRSVAVPGSRERHYRADDIERFRLSRGGEHGREMLIPVIDSAICLIEGGRFFYRGHDALHLAETATLEEVADLLWAAGDLSAITPPLPSPAGGGRLGRGRSREAFSQGQKPRSAVAFAPSGLIERVQVRLATLAAADLAALDLRRAGTIRTGRAILTELVGAIAGAAIAGAEPDGGPEGEAVHQRLAAAWGLDKAGADLLRRILVLLADHELNASAFVARIVASTGATPYAVVSAAFGALSGRKHGGASARAEALFGEIGNALDPMPVLAARLARGEDLPGIGHPLYPDGDPRARAIIAAIAAARPETGARVTAAARAARQLTGEHPNVDFALGAAVTALGLPEGSALALFMVGRTVGWIAQAIEQYESDVLIRPRARYTGPRPSIAVSGEAG